MYNVLKMTRNNTRTVNFNQKEIGVKLAGILISTFHFADNIVVLTKSERHKCNEYHVQRI